MLLDKKRGLRGPFLLRAERLAVSQEMLRSTGSNPPQEIHLADRQALVAQDAVGGA